MNFDSMRPYLAKIIGPLLGALAVIVKHKLGIEFSDAEIQQAVSPVVDLVIFAISAGVSGVTVNKSINPGNAASSHLAGKEKGEAEVLKATENFRSVGRSR